MTGFFVNTTLGCEMDELISCLCSRSIPPENIRKPVVF